MYAGKTNHNSSTGGQVNLVLGG